MGYANKDITLSGSTAGSIGHFTNISWDGPQASEIDVTDSDSANDYREKIGGLIDAGTINLDHRYNAALLDTLIDAIGVSQTWTMTLPDGTTVVSTGTLLKGPNVGGAFDDAVNMTGVSISLSGPPTVTVAT